MDDIQKNKLKKNNIADIIRQRIISRFYPVACKLPGQLVLCSEFNVARETLRNALAILEREGLIRSIQGKGTYVHYSTEKHLKKKILGIATLQNMKLSSYTLLHRFEENAKKNNIDLQLCDYDLVKSMGTLRFSKFLSQCDVDGIFLIASNFYGNEDILETLQNLSIPIVLVLGSKQDYLLTGYPSCVLNIKNAWAIALQHLKAQGHCRIGMITVPDGAIFRGFAPDELIDFLISIGIDTSSELFVKNPQLRHDSENRDELIKKEVNRMLSLEHPPSAFICHSGYWAPPVYQALEQNGLMPGKDIAVMGFLDDFNGDCLNPALSCVEMDFQYLFENVFNLIVKSRDWKTEDSPRPYVEMLFHLVIKESTALKYKNNI